MSADIGTKCSELVFRPIFLGKGQVVGLICSKTPLVEVLQVHLVDGDHDMPDAQQGRDETVPAGLGLHAVAGIDQMIARSQVEAPVAMLRVYCS